MLWLVIKEDVGQLFQNKDIHLHIVRVLSEHLLLHPNILLLEVKELLKEVEWIHQVILQT